MGVKYVNKTKKALTNFEFAHSSYLQHFPSAYFSMLLPTSYELGNKDNCTNK